MLSEEDDILRARMNLTLACVELARTDTWSATAEVLSSARIYGKLLLTKEQADGERGVSAPHEPRAVEAPIAAPAAPPPASASEGASGLIFPREEAASTRIVRPDDLTATSICANCGEARKPLFCCAQCANEHSTLY